MTFSPRDFYEPYIDPAVAHLKDGSLELMALVGSRAYGTHNEDSDHDWKGVYIATTRRMFAIDQSAPGNQTVPGNDTTLYELASFCKLAAAANPTVLEILWAESITSVAGQKLKANRHLFLSRRIEKTYGGYAEGQLAKAREGSGGSRGHNQYKRTKFKLHTMRLIDAGIHALKFGDLQVKIPDPAGLREKAESFTLEQLAEYVHNGFEIMRLMALNSPLPEEPDYDKINELVYDLRMRPDDGYTREDREMDEQT